jgi:hypothetical protein
VRRAARLALLALACMAGRAAAQQAGGDWTFSASAYLYPDDDPSFLLPIVTADRGPLHLEARYNYEDLETVSGWVGWTFEAGDKLTLAVTPMLGGVLGRTDGIAPGVELTLGWRAFELYSESEYVIPLGDDSADFLYTWTQLTWSPLERLSVGVSGQRLASTGSDRLIDSGPMAAFQLGPVDLEAFVYNPFSDDAFTVLGASIAF